jgi:hypothetical protein
MHRRRVGSAIVALALTLAGCGSEAAPDAGSQTSSAVAISSAEQLADAVGCTGYKPNTPTGFKEGGDCTIGGVDFHLYVFASNSDRNALVNGIFRTSNDVKYAIGDKYTIASLDEATITTAAGKIGATVQ